MKSFLDLLSEDLIASKTIGQLTLSGVMWALGMAFLAGVMIYLVYRFAYSGVMFVNNFAVTLIGLTLITCLIILTITSNLLLSLGMVGALSIVRFRTAIKEPLDMIYMFWSIAIGVTIGAGFFMLATVGMILIGAVLLIMSRISFSSHLYIMVIRHENISNDALNQLLKEHTKSFRFRAEIHINDTKEMTYELRIKDSSEGLIEAIKESLGVKDISLVSYQSNTLV